MSYEVSKGVALLNGVESSSIVSSQIVKFDPGFATKQLLGGVDKTPGGWQIMLHAAERMVDPPKGPLPVTMSEIDTFFDTADGVRKVTPTKDGLTLTIRNSACPKMEVVISNDGSRVITVIKNHTEQINYNRYE